MICNIISLINDNQGFENNVGHITRIKILLKINGLQTDINNE